MNKYKPIQGKGSKAAAKRTLERDPKRFNISRRYCPVIKEDCKTYVCASWKKAEVFLSNPGRLESKDNIYDIENGYCQNSSITGEIRCLKG